MVVVVSGQGELTLGGQVHPLTPMALVHVPKGTVRAIAAVDGPLAYLFGPPPPIGGPAGRPARPAALRPKAAAAANAACLHLGRRRNSLTSTLVSLSGNATREVDRR